LIYFATSQFMNGDLNTRGKTEIIKGNNHEISAPQELRGGSFRTLGEITLL
jgi:hypothetical protein